MSETAIDAARETAEYWMRCWLDQPVASLEAWCVEGPDRPRAADRAEMAIRRPPRWPAMGVVRDEVRVRRQVARRWLEEADQELAAGLERRRRLVERIDACTLALVGTRGLGARGVFVAPEDARTGPVPGDPAMRTLAFEPPARSEPSEPSARIEPSSAMSAWALRRAVVDLVRAADMPLDLVEIQRLLELQGVTVSGRPSQTLSNALRPAVARGDLVRLRRGCYAPGDHRAD